MARSWDQRPDDQRRLHLDDPFSVLLRNLPLDGTTGKRTVSVHFEQGKIAVKTAAGVLNLRNISFGFGSHLVAEA
jgi:hypothetical protein